KVATAASSLFCATSGWATTVAATSSTWSKRFMLPPSSATAHAPRSLQYALSLPATRMRETRLPWQPPRRVSRSGGCRRVIASAFELRVADLGEPYRAAVRPLHVERAAARPAVDLIGRAAVTGNLDAELPRESAHVIEVAHDEAPPLDASGLAPHGRLRIVNHEPRVGRDRYDDDALAPCAGRGQKTEDARVEAHGTPQIVREDVDLGGSPPRSNGPLDRAPCNDVLHLYHLVASCRSRCPARRAVPAGKQDASFSREPKKSSSRPPKPIHLRGASIAVVGLADDEQHVARGQWQRLVYAGIVELDGRLDAPCDASAAALEQRQHLVDAVHRAAEEHASARSEEHTSELQSRENLV